MPQVGALIGGAINWVGGLFGAGGAGGVGAGAGGAAGGVTATSATAFAGGAGLTTAGTSTFVGQVANAAFQLAVSTALSVAFQPNVGGSGGMVLKWRADPDGGVPYVFGRVGTGGAMAMKDVYGGNKARHFHTVSVLSIGPIEGIDAFYANDVETTFAANRNAVGYYHDVMWRDYKLGNASETAHAPLSPPYSLTLSANWTSDHKLSDLATAQWICRYNHLTYSTGPAQPLDVVLGPAAYDPREDSSVPGGSGSQDSTDRTTWTFAGNTNPFLQSISWCLGITVQGEVQMGIGAPLSMIDVQPFIDGANVCEANGWTVGGVALSTDAKYTVLEQLLRAGGGRPIPRGGRFSCLVQAPRVSIATLTGADILGTASLSGPPGRRDRFNTVMPRYREEDRNWEMITADPVSVSAFVTADGGKRPKEIVYPYVLDKDQAAQLARYDIWESREAGPWELELRPRWRAFKPGDCFTLNEPELGWDNIKVLVRETTRNPTTGRRVVRVWTETDAKHADALGTTGTIPAAGAFDTTDPGIDPPDSGTFTATGGSITYNGAETPAIFITGTVDSVEATDIIVRIRLDGSSDDWEYHSWPVTADRMAIATVGALSDYEVQYNYRSVRGSVGESWTPDTGVATTGDLLPQDGSVSAVKLQDNSVGETKLQDASVAEAKLQDASVGEVKLQASSVSTGKMADGSIITQKIQDEQVTVLTQQTRPSGFGGGGAIGIAWRTAAFTTFTKLDEYVFDYSGEGAIQMLWTGLIQWQRNASSRVLFFICLNQTPTYSFGAYGNFQGDPIEYQGNQDALTVPAILPINLSGLTPGSNTLSIWGQSVENTATIPILGVGSAFLDITGKK